MKIYDAIIIGSGQAGTPLAKKLAQSGLKTALIEKKYIGGSCVNYGCTPTKAMIASARTAYLASQAKTLGINTGPVSADLKKIVARKNEIVQSFRNGSEDNLNKVAGLDIYFGEASFKDQNTVRVEIINKSNVLLKAKKIFINTGTRPAIPEIRGISEIHYLDSTSILDLHEIPQHLLIIGGAYIALEFGQMFRRFGSKVTVLEQSPQFLPREDDDVAGEMKQILEDEGLSILTGTKTRSLKNVAKGKITAVLSVNRQRKVLTCSHVLVAAGRVPNTEELNLQKAGVYADVQGFIKVNNKLKTNIKDIYALGDVKGGPAFTHISYNDYLVISKNLFEKKSASIKSRMVPWCMFTDPQLARIGITEKEAEEQGQKILVARLKMSSVARAIETGDTRGLMKAIVDHKTKKILGAAIIGTEGGEVMTVLQMAMMGGVTYPEIRDGVFAHPTFAESLNNLFMTLDSE